MTGTLRFRKTKHGPGSWNFLWHERGRQRSHTFAAVPGETKRQAWKRLAEPIARLLADRTRDLAQLTVAELLERWLQDARPASEVSRERYERAARKQLVPALGTFTLGELRVYDVTAFRHHLEERGLVAASVRFPLLVLKMALRWGVKQQLVERDVALAICDGVDLPVPGKAPSRIYTPEDLLRLEAELERRESLGRAVQVQMLTGMRPSEVCGLRWSDIEVDRLWVRQRIVRLKGQGLQTAKPKTEASERALGLSPRLAEVFRLQRIWQHEWNLRIRGGWQNAGDLVFTTRFAGPLETRKLGETFHAARTAAGLPYCRPYDLRHTWVSLMLGSGAPLRDVSEAAGHRDPGFTMRTYGHARPEAAKRLATAFDRLLEGVSDQNSDTESDAG